MVGYSNVILSSVNWQLTTSNRFSCTRLSSPIAWCAKQWHCRLEKGIHGRGNWYTINYTSNRRYLPLREMRLRHGKHNNMWKIKRLEHQMASSGILNASAQQLLSYPNFSILFISVCLSIWWTGYQPSSNNMPGLTNSTNLWRWYLHMMASPDLTSHIARRHNGLVRRE